MKLKLVLLFCSLYTIALAQKLHRTAIDTTLVVNEYGGFWDDMQLLYANLPRIKNSPYKYHFRYRENNQVADIYSNDGINFKGRILNNVILENSDTIKRKENLRDTYIFRYTNVKSDKASQIGQFIIRNKINTIPSRENFPQWNIYSIGGGGISFDFKADEAITHTIYDCPRCQDNTHEDVLKIKKLYFDLRSILNWNQLFVNFNDKLEPGRYYYDGFFSWDSPIKDKVRKWKKRRRAEGKIAPYIKVIEEHLTTALKNTNRSELPADGRYKIYFNKKGKVKKVVYDADRYIKVSSYNAKKIKAIFKNNGIKNLNLKYGFVQVLYTFANSNPFMSRFYGGGYYPKEEHY
ncbi:hypothetical protein [Flavobacterium sp. NRK1]|uniref:hypothetical protein n=1 Tax=Flavobacterium sp. NRK1 TaxID=2954929 RepID=UPI00209204D6|nr:hypothetical protein [Flavobacterium sp. NRK1]MCO6147341.1 hypothetical protein [Flavobacterium sp. NRK1]